MLNSEWFYNPYSKINQNSLGHPQIRRFKKQNNNQSQLNNYLKFQCYCLLIYVLYY